MCQEFNLIIKDKKGVENVVADHLSRYHLYTLASTSFSQIELTLRDLNFYNDGTPQ